MFPSVVSQPVQGSSDDPVRDDGQNWLLNRSYNKPNVPVVTIDDEFCGEEEQIVKISSSPEDKQPTLELDDGTRRRDKSRKSSKKKSRSRKRDRTTRDRSRSGSRKKYSRDELRQTKHKKSRYKSTKRSPSRDTSYDSQDQTTHQASKSVFIGETGLKPDKAFRIDRTSDRNNLAFESVYYLLVPKYNKKKCLKSRRVQELLASKSSKTNYRYFTAKRFADDCVENLKPSVDPKKSLEDYVPVKSSVSKSKTYTDLSNPKTDLFGSLSTIHDVATSLYVKGKGVPNVEQNCGSSDDNNQSQSASFDDSELTDKTKYFNKHLRDNPHDIDAWLKLIKYQEDCFVWEPAKCANKSKEIILNEKKLSIIEKAIDQNPKCLQLKLERLNILRHILSADEIDKEWKKLTFVYPNNPSVWQNYFTFLQSHVSYFTVSRMVKAFQKCLDVFENMIEGSFQSHKPPPNLELETLNIVLQYTSFLKHCGFIERSIAIWQALVEFNLFAPETLSESSLADCLTLFEPFWDSGCPRFGEKGSIGWKNVIENYNFSQDTLSLPSIDTLEDQIVASNKQRAEIWLNLEKIREENYWLPIKGSHVESVDDTERMVTFQAIRPSLFRFKQPKNKFQILIHFLKFLGALENERESSPFFSLETSSILGSLPTLVSLPTNSNYVDFYIFSDDIFSRSIEYLEKFDAERSRSLIENHFIFLVSSCGKYLPYKTVKSRLKEYLKLDENRNDLKIWTLLAELERHKGKEKEARAIYETAIAMFMGRMDPKYLLKFVMKYAEMILHLTPIQSVCFKGYDMETQGLDGIVLKSIFDTVLGRKIGSTDLNSNISKVLRILTTLSESQIIEQESRSAIEKSLILVIFLTGDPEKSFQTCEELLDSLQETAVLEEFWTFYISLHILHVNRSGQSISHLRQTVQKALDSFPSNRAFLSLFIEIGSKVAMPIMLQRSFTRLIKRTESCQLNLWIFYLYSEIKRLKVCQGDQVNSQCSDGLVRKVISTFEKCLSFPRNRDYPVLWRMYAQFLSDYNLKDKCESIIYRALQSCPWAKQIYMDTLLHLPHLLEKIISIMGEKEIRLRTIIEEIDLLQQPLQTIEPEKQDV
ncbi:nuclear exosome regulator NRDE2-like [Brevipalpus obovatus]|uniref:nuclear exosome regulator NRDE2-like n=1 Tax=Brevipalpus obovatus TaxID=246614 RepID=UPI003D9E0501